MLINIPEAIARAARTTVINHPNTCSCNIFRKTVYQGGVVASNTIGGLGVADSEDAGEFQYTFISNGWMIPADAYTMTELSNDKYVADNPNQEKPFLIEPETEGTLIQIHDIVYLILSVNFELRIGYEIIRIDSPINIPPYLNKYILNRRLDIDVIGSPN